MSLIPISAVYEIGSRTDHIKAELDLFLTVSKTFKNTILFIYENRECASVSSLFEKLIHVNTWLYV